MDIRDAATILNGYGGLRKLVRERAMAKLTGPDPKKVPHALRYIELTSIYVEGENIIVSFEYNEPYSGSEEVILTASDIA